MTDIDVPGVLRENVSEVWGAAGRRWIGELPTLLGEITDVWDLSVGDPYQLSLNWVTPAVGSDGRPAVLKLGVPGSNHLGNEAAALTCFDGDGAVRLLDRDARRGALLLERAEPGTMLRDLVPERDGEATAAVVELLRRLHKPAATGTALPELARYAESFRQHLAEHPDHPLLPHSMVERAAGLFGELCASSTERVVLHGDLHHDNVLSSDREAWLAIDPHGEVGDPGYDIAPMLYNPDPWIRDDELLALVPARIEQAADGLKMSVDRATAWGFVGAVLSEVWFAEHGEPGGRPIDIARLLEPELG